MKSMLFVDDHPIYRDGFQRALTGASPDIRIFLAAVTPKVAVLVVDDDPLVTDAMGRLIASWGLHVETCHTGERAIDILHARDSSFRWEALVDYRLSEPENGLAVIDRIRRTFGWSVGTTLMTAEIDSAILEQAAECTISVLCKPVKPIRLRSFLTVPLTEQPDRRDIKANDPSKEAMT